MAYSMESKYNGFCKKCKKRINKGDLITKDENLKAWVHLRCPAEPVTVASLLKGKGNSALHEEGADVLSETKVFLPSVFQQAVFDWIVSGTGHAVIEAVAGSGKTTTIVKGMQLLDTSLRVMFLAFNKHIVKELKRRMVNYPNIRVATVHSLGLSIIRKHNQFDKRNGVDDEKLSLIMDDFWSVSKKEVPDTTTRMTHIVYRAATRKIVSLVKATMTDYTDLNAVLDLINHYEIDLDEQVEQVVLDKLGYIMETSINDLTTIDFNDMTYLPVVHPELANKFDEYDFILIDEAQDLNANNAELILRCLAPGGRVLAVGDRFQSLYGFRGADVKAIPNLITRLQATTLPLSISYRCPRSHVERVQELVPQIQAADNAIEGIYEEIFYDKLLDTVAEGDMVLCRTNAPLVKPAFRVIQRGIKAIIRGKNIGQELVNFVNRFECDELARLHAMMAEHTERECERLMEKGKEMLAENLMDKYLTIVEVANECKNVPELVVKLEMLFSDDNVGVVFSSVHRSKGLEAERVFLLRPEIMPHPKAKEGWQMEQEMNIKYVAGTRSLREFYVVIGGEE